MGYHAPVLLMNTVTEESNDAKENNRRVSVYFGEEVILGHGAWSGLLGRVYLPQSV